MSEHNEHDEENLDHNNSSNSNFESARASIRPELLLSDRAIAAAKQFQAENENWRGQPLRVYLSGKGCDGFDYGVCFDQQDPNDQVFDIQTIRLICDPETFKFIAGSTIDFVDDERGRGFIVENPRHKQFRGKFYRRKGWEDRLKI